MPCVRGAPLQVDATRGAASAYVVFKDAAAVAQALELNMTEVRAAP